MDHAVVLQPHHSSRRIDNLGKQGYVGIVAAFRLNSPAFYSGMDFGSISPFEQVGIHVVCFCTHSISGEAEACVCYGLRQQSR